MSKIDGTAHGSPRLCRVGAIAVLAAGTGAAPRSAAPPLSHRAGLLLREADPRHGGLLASPFLTANWRHLCLFTYRCPPEVLSPHCPPGTTLDLLEGNAHVSLVAFDFLQTRVRGVAWPGFVNFPEINLRFYVRSGERRGVVFIREYVPKRFVAWLARRLYNEPYRPAPMRSKVVQSNGAISASHLLKTPSGHQVLKIVAHRTPSVPPRGSVEHHFKEHRWGFGVDRHGRLLAYEVRHPQWEIYPVSSYELHWNWSDVYGPQWAFLQDETPVSVILAAGSEVAVYPHAQSS